MSIRKFLEKPEDFIVEELTEKKFLKKFSRTSKGVEIAKGRYFLCLLKKKNMTTERALQIVARRFSIPKNDIGYAGLKDKFAVTTQYITTPVFHEIGEENLTVKKIGMTDKKIGVGDLVGNKFTITLHGVKKINPVNSIPNYFGEQRFGVNKDNHIIGKKILQRKYDIKGLAKERIKFFIHAYQSYIFNKMLAEYIERNKKPINKETELVGFNSNGRDAFSLISMKLMKKDGIKPESFEFKDLKLKCVGSERPLFAEVNNFSCTKKQNRTVLEFTLPKGSYGTVVIDFAMKSKKKQAI